MAGIGQQAVGNIGDGARDADQSRPQRRARLRQAITLLERRVKRDPTCPRAASRPSAPSPIVPVTKSRSPARAPARAEAAPMRATRPKAVTVTVSGPGVVTVSPPLSTMP